MVQLEDFIETTLAQIMTGVKKAQEAAKGLGAKVNPTGLNYSQTQDGGYDEDNNISRLVHFDLALTTSEGEAKKAGVGVFSGLVGVGAHGQKEQASSTVSRIQFTVPLMLPGDKG